MTKTRRRAPAAAGKSAGPVRKRRGAEPNAGLKADLKEKLAPAAGAHEPLEKPKAAAAVTAVEPPAPEAADVVPMVSGQAAPGQVAPANDQGPATRPRGLADPLTG